MPYGKDGVFYLYDQRDDREKGPITAPFGWSLATTSDFVQYLDHGDSIKKGTDLDRDQFIYAGCVFEGEEKIRAFYTGHNRIWQHQNKTAEVLLQASSSDFKTWIKEENAIALNPQVGYDNGDWRDPWVIWNDQKQEYLLILGARLEGPKTRQTGRIVHFTSKNLNDWTFQGDFWISDRFTMIEMPDLFRMGDWWYLVYTEYSQQSKTHYVMSKSLEGPWITPKDDSFDGRAYYAARTAYDGSRRVLFGWVASREDENDVKPFQWGGTYVPHEIYQHADGTLGVKIVESLRQGFSTPELLPKTKIENSYGRTEALILEKTTNTFKLETSIEFSSATRDFSLRIRKNVDTDESYEFLFSLVEGQLRFDCNPNYPWFQILDKGLERPLNLECDKKYDLVLIVDGSIFTIYINGTALNVRAYRSFGHGLAVAVNCGSLRLENIKYSSGLRK